MCTLSVIAMPRPESGYRVVFNRDESRTRAPATAPLWRSFPELGPLHRAIWPTDTAAGGTWIASSARGMTLCLLNHHPLEPVPLPPASELMSRGLIIPALIHQPDAAEAVGELPRLDLWRFAPFRLAAIDPWAGRNGEPRIIVVRWDRRELTLDRHDPAPACLVSSSLGDHLVQARVELFNRVVPRPNLASEAARAANRADQDDFHAHHWPHSPHTSVLMSRTDAATVSRTVVEVSLDPRERTGVRVVMRYTPLPLQAPPASLQTTRDLDWTQSSASGAD